MVQPDLTHGFWTSPFSPLGIGRLGKDSTGDSAPGRTAPEALPDCATDPATTQHFLGRIHHLEQALDQAMLYLSELRGQLQNQTFLEAQLARTEEYANVQHEAITSLKVQLQQRQEDLSAATAALLRRDRLLLEMLAITIRANRLQQPAYHQLSLPLEGASSADRVLELEAEILAAQTQVAALNTQLSDAHQTIQALTAKIVQLETDLNQVRLTLREQPVLELTLRQTKQLASERNAAIETLQKDLAIAQMKVDELEAQLTRQIRSQAKWQQTCHELELEREDYRTRISALEQEVSEMQEQIFDQARQAGEYEAAIQHWKDRYGAGQRQLVQLKDMLEQELTQTTAGNEPSQDTILVQLLTALQLWVERRDDLPVDNAALTPSRFQPLDLPDFLFRRRSHRNRFSD